MSSMDNIRIAAVGDISLHARGNTPAQAVMGFGIKDLLKNSDVILGNLEGPLASHGNCTPGKCSLVSDPACIRDLVDCGFHVVSLANNHIMDYGPEGLHETIELLSKCGIAGIGAGANLYEANKPFFKTARGRRVAFLARSSVIVSSPSYATEKTPGVAFFEMEELKNTIRKCRDLADNIILSIHWGIEHYSYPSPLQRDLAKELIGSGADVIIGHHPHVLQGLEKIGKGIVAYSIGNFIFDDIRWSYTNEDGVIRERLVKLNDENRKTCILKIELSGKDDFSSEFIPAIISSSGTVEIDEHRTRIKEYHRLCSRLAWPFYRTIWKIYSIKQEWILRVIPMLRGRFRWRSLKNLRFKHIREIIVKLRRSARISTEKTTNPYE
jgi:poly-gamma-glutamate capsule biosynthesis protein CapA/YwtB (metallophosphatase superfamily)